MRLHDRLTADVTATVEVSGVVRLGAPLELPAEYLPRVIAAVAREHPGIEIVAQHASTTAQWAALRDDTLDAGLVRELVPGEEYDATLVVEDRLGVLLAVDRARELAAPDGSIELHRLSALTWNGFARSDTPASYDNVAAVLRAHGIRVPEHADDQRPVTPEVKLATVADGTRFALALPDFPVTSGVSWHRLAGDPIVRRTWAVWRADAVRRDLAVVIAALEAAAP